MGRCPTPRRICTTTHSSGQSKGFAAEVGRPSRLPPSKMNRLSQTNPIGLPHFSSRNPLYHRWINAVFSGGQIGFVSQKHMFLRLPSLAGSGAGVPPVSFRLRVEQAPRLYPSASGYMFPFGVARRLARVVHFGSASPSGVLRLVAALPFRSCLPPFVLGEMRFRYAEGCLKHRLAELSPSAPASGLNSESSSVSPTIPAQEHDVQQNYRFTIHPAYSHGSYRPRALRGGDLGGVLLDYSACHPELVEGSLSLRSLPFALGWVTLPRL